MANADFSQALTVGTFLQNGKYRIVRFISSGGFGCTYEAVHTFFDKRVAIKELFISDYCNRDNRTGWVSVGTESKRDLVNHLYRKFLEEAKAQHAMSHPGIVSVSDVFEENGTAYYVMDYVDGESLEQLLRNRPNHSLSEQEALGYIRQVAEALGYVHSLNRLHLDVKPGNIMIDRSGRAILIDFGASKQFDEQGLNKSTLLAMTPGYASPEQSSRNLGEFSPSADVYSLGATLYRLLSGEAPPDCLLRSVKGIKPLPASVSPSTRHAVEQAMQLDGSQRPQSMREFLDLLDGGTPGYDSADDKTINIHDTEINTPSGRGSNGGGGNSAPPRDPAGRSTSDTLRRKSNLKWIYIVICIAVMAFGVSLFVLVENVPNQPLDSVPNTAVALQEGDDVQLSKVPEGMVDLGLSVYWADHNVADGQSEFMSMEAIKEYISDHPDLGKLPTKEQWEELMDKNKCEWKKEDNGYTITGYATGNSIRLPANGIFSDGAVVDINGGYGSYWLDSNEYYVSLFDDTDMGFSESTAGDRYCVRLVSPKK